MDDNTMTVCNEEGVGMVGGTTLQSRQSQLCGVDPGQDARSGVAAKGAMSAMDALGDRIKAYEQREGARRTMPGLPVVVRLDGRSFSRFTRGMARPYDQDMADLMVEVARYLVEHTNARVAYTQSDEISLILDHGTTPGLGQVELELQALEEQARGGMFGRMLEGITALLEAMRRRRTPEPELMFSGRLQKMVSVTAGLATARFVQGAVQLWPERCARGLPVFDSRVFEVPTREDAVNAVLWREMDATKNAVSMAAQSFFEHSRLHGRSAAQMQEMLWSEHGVNFNDYPARFKRGVYLQRRSVLRELDADQLARIAPARRPRGPIERTCIEVLDLPPLARVVNRVDVLFDGAEPVLHTHEPAPPVQGAGVPAMPSLDSGGARPGPD